MASSHFLNLRATPVRFFKIVLSDIGSHTKLMIPRKFAGIFVEKNRINHVYLNAPNGSVWSVDLEKHKDEVWLHNGWPEFAKYYSISFGYLLVFEYKGDSKFEVLIFDQSALEIDYPLTCTDGDSVKSTQVKKKETDATHSEAIRPRKKTRAKSACNGEENRALVLATAFKSENPFVILSVKPSHVDGSSPVHITATFREVCTKWMNNVEVILQVGRRTWPVYSHLNSKWARCTLGVGWARFARDNSLNVGDACVFELINPARKLFKVYVFRATAEAR